MQMRYFSFVTLATVGYGDDRAAHTNGADDGVARSDARQLYLVALMGRLVGLHIVSTEMNDRKNRVELLHFVAHGLNQFVVEIDVYLVIARRK